MTGLEIGSCKNDSNLPMVDTFFLLKTSTFYSSPLIYPKKDGQSFLKKKLIMIRVPAELSIEANPGSSTMRNAPIDHHWWYGQWLRTCDPR